MVQYLSNNIEDAKYKLVYSVSDIEGVNFNRGVVIGIESFLSLPAEMRQLKIAEKSTIEKSNRVTDVYQAVSEGKVPAPTKADLGLD